MRNAKLGLFSMLCAVFMFGITTAFDINVGQESYYGTLTLNRVNIMKSYGITGIVLDGTGYEISIASGATPGYGKISVYQICGQGGGNCKPVSQLSTTTPVMNSIDDNGLVEKTNGVVNKVWKTDASGRPQWLDDATGSISINAYTPTLSRGSPSTIIKINDSTATVTLPSNPHYVGSIVAAASSGGNSNSNNNTTNDSTYLNYVENSNVKSYIKVKGSGSTTVSAKNGTITITSTGGGGGDTLWEKPSGTSKIRNKNSSDVLVIGRDNELTSRYISLEGNGNYYTPNLCLPSGTPPDRSGGQIIQYFSNIIFRHGAPVTCSNDKQIVINNYGLGIGVEPDSTYNLYVLGATYSSTAYIPNGATIGSHYFYSQKVGIKMEPQDDINANLQVNGAIYISSNGHGTTCTNGTIDYTGNNFYGCVNGSWKKFTMGNALQN